MNKVTHEPRWQEASSSYLRALTWVITIGSLPSFFLTKRMSNKSAFFVQRAHPYRAFLRNHTRTNLTGSHNYRAVTSTFQTCSRTYRTINPHLYTSSTTSEGSTQLPLLHQTCSWNYRTVNQSITGIYNSYHHLQHERSLRSYSFVVVISNTQS